LFEEYIFGKQTLKQLSAKYGKTKETIRRHLDQYRTAKDQPTAESTVIDMDCTFFGRGYGIIVARSPSLKRNLYWKEITTENKAVYQEARQYLEEAGFTIQAVVIDAKHV